MSTERPRFSLHLPVNQLTCGLGARGHLPAEPCVCVCVPLVSPGLRQAQEHPSLLQEAVLLLQTGDHVEPRLPPQVTLLHQIVYQERLEGRRG